MAKINNVGEKCLHCDTPVILKESKFKPSKLLKPYYYTAYFKCEGCGTFYMNNKFKILNGKHKKKKKKRKQKKNSLKKLKTMQYDRYVRTGHWQRIKRNYYKKHKKICYCCGEDSYVLHHINYSRRGEEKDKDLVTLCENCHNEVHNLILNEDDIKLKNGHIVHKQLLELKLY